MNKKNYIIPAIDVIDNEDLCTKMNGASWDSNTENAAEDQKDVTPGTPEVGGELSGDPGAKVSSWGSWSDE